jgi:hypothetical protein
MLQNLNGKQMEKIPKANLPNLHYELPSGIIQSKKINPSPLS